MSEYAELVIRLGERLVASPAPYYKPDPDCQEARAAIIALETQVKELREALAIFLGEDERFQVAVGGNPIAVDAMLAKVRILAAQEKGNK